MLLRPSILRIAIKIISKGYFWSLIAYAKEVTWNKIKTSNNDDEDDGGDDDDDDDDDDDGNDDYDDDGDVDDDDDDGDEEVMMMMMMMMVMTMMGMVMMIMMMMTMVMTMVMLMTPTTTTPMPMINYHRPFDVIVSVGVSYSPGGYHFEIDDGRVRWFHRSRLRDPVFSVLTEEIIPSDVWSHIVGTYNATTGEAKVTKQPDTNSKKVEELSGPIKQLDR